MKSNETAGYISVSTAQEINIGFDFGGKHEALRWFLSFSSHFKIFFFFFLRPKRGFKAAMRALEL